jgi:hypothetical protein
MGFEDFFEQGHKRHKYGQHFHQDHDDHNYHQYDDHPRVPYHNFPASNYKLRLLEKFRDNPKFRKLAVMAIMMLLILGVFVIILIFPIIIKVVGYISQNGLQGLIDVIWKGQK